MDLKKIKSDLSSFAQKHKGEKIGILYGALSFEDQKYIETAPEDQASGAALYKAMDELGFLPVYINPTKDNLIEKAKECSLVFNNLHGEFGEDGAVQALFKYHGIKYTGAYILAHSIGLNKAVCKYLAKGIGIQTPNFSVIYTNDDPKKIIKLAKQKFNIPWVTKPLHGGGSVGIRLVHSEIDALPYFEQVMQYDTGVLIEEYVEGIDITIGILEINNKPFLMPPLKISIDSKLYDENIKLKNHWKGGVHYECPAKIEQSLTDLLKELSLKIYLIIQCSGFARIDWRVSESGIPHFLEINTNPGISEGGNFALGAYAMGLTYHELILAMLKLCDE